MCSECLKIPGRAFDITYIRLKFHSMRPESFAVYKRTRPGSPWVPYQYYSSTCHDTYGLQSSTYATRDDETKALCTGEYSGLSPLSGGNVAFSTLEGRPSAFHFEHSKLLQVSHRGAPFSLSRYNATSRGRCKGEKRPPKS
ncbi:hypothetical protein HPB52_011597 [Rhipicephalus sanguineus]|uniref:Laminin N-terminal domain-containing protein n=1 Tax=Rhipicephalus sanguineus TaxID=34632 RepID=A0A9D4T9K8_RHISA|nr:hypothetical protein HPB52_011597 [Rhipicephalus sanguineus]